jgi:carbon-monoxide dehydrogenase large subunit
MIDEFRRFAEGRGQFVDDLRLPNMLHLKVVRSPYARARILKVKGGMNGSEVKLNLASVGEGAGWGDSADIQAVSHPVLASEYVSYAGQPVAAVTSEDLYSATDAMEEVDIEYDPLKPVMDPEEALRSEPIHPSTKSNVITSVQIGKDFNLPNSPVRLEEVFVNERITPNPIEPRGLVAHYDGSKLTVWASTQSVHSWKDGLCDSLGLPPEKVRVIQVDTGGAFGCKSAVYAEYVLACYTSMKTRRPVKWIETRSEHLRVTNQGRGVRGKMEIFADKTGILEGLKADLLIDGGAYPVGIGAWAPTWIGFQLTGPYAIRQAIVHGRSVYTNKAPLGPYRGAGRPEAAFFIERTMDLLADHLGMDPVEVRLRNTSNEPITSPLGPRHEPFKPFLKSAIRELDYRRRAQAGNVGFSCFILVPAVQPGESARINVSGGRVRVWMGTISHGQGHEVFARMLVSEELGVPEAKIDVQKGDTDQLAEGIGTWGSRTAIVATGALLQACRKIEEEYKAKFGKYDSEKLLRYEFDASEFYSRLKPLNSFGANLVSAHVDELGKIWIDECDAYYDVGRALNPAMIESQIIGGSGQGIGQTLYEEARYDEDGQLLAATIADAGVAKANHMPRFTIKLRKNVPPSRQPRGVGESATVGVPPAAIRAIEKITGRRLTKTPVRSDELPHYGLRVDAEHLN